MSNPKKLINLTPHPIKVVTDYGTAEIPASGLVARVQQQPSTTVGTIGTLGEGCVALPVVDAPVFGEVEWPEFDKTEYGCALVSMLVGQAVAALPDEERPDFPVFAPNTAPDSVLRDEDGRIDGVRSIVVYSWGNHSPEEE